MISCRKCLNVLVAIERFRGSNFCKSPLNSFLLWSFAALSTSQRIVGSLSKNLAYRGKCISNFKNVSSSSSYSPENLTSVTELNDVEKVCEEEFELHEEESEGVHETYIENFVNQSNAGTDIPLEGVPAIKVMGSETEIVDANKKNNSKVLKDFIKSDKKGRTKKSIEDLKLEAVELEKKKEISFRYSLKSYLTMCMGQDMVYKAMILLRNYHAEKKYFQSSEVYDAVLREAASHCSWKLIKEIVMMMEEGAVPFSLDSFAACFICLGRRSEQEKGITPVADNLLDKMVSCGLNVEDIFLKCKFTDNHRELAVKGIRLSIPDFQPAFPTIPSTYTTPLLDSLNDLNVDSVVPSQVSGLLTEEKYSFISLNS